MSALIWDLCWIIFAMYSADFTCSLNGSSSQVCVTRIAFRDQYLGFQIKIFREIISLSVVVCSFIDNISSKHDPETTASKLNLMLLTLIHASRLWMSANSIGFLLLGSVFGHFFDTQLMNFIWKYAGFSDYSRFVRCKFTTDRESLKYCFYFENSRSFKWAKSCKLR